MRRSPTALLILLLCGVFGQAQAEPILHVSPSMLSFTGSIDALELNIANAGDGDLEWDIKPSSSWLSVDVDAGVNDGQVKVTVDRTGLDGTYFAGLEVFSNGGDVRVDVVLYATKNPILTVDPTGLVFSPSVSVNKIELGNNGGGTLEWSLIADQPWIVIRSPLSGSGPTTVTVTVDVTTLPQGYTYQGIIAVNSNGGAQKVLVRAEPPLLASGGNIGLYADASGLDCNLVDSAPGLLRIYVVHTNVGTVTASEFSAPLPACMVGAIWVGDTPVFPITLNDSQKGVSIAYGSCLSAPIHVLTINVIVAGKSEECCAYSVLNNSYTGKILTTDCASPFPNRLSGTGGAAVVNAKAGCVCGALPTRETTWGEVKALYRSE